MTYTHKVLVCEKSTIMFVCIPWRHISNKKITYSNGKESSFSLTSRTINRTCKHCSTHTHTHNHMHTWNRAGRLTVFVFNKVWLDGWMYECLLWPCLKIVWYCRQSGVLAVLQIVNRIYRNLFVVYVCVCLSVWLYYAITLLALLLAHRKKVIQCYNVFVFFPPRTKPKCMLLFYHNNLLDIK